MSIANIFKMRVSLLMALIFLAVFICSGIKDFSAWPQVTELWQEKVSFESLVGHPHFFRLMVVYPGLALEDWSPGSGFTLYCSIFLVLNAMLWSNILWKNSYFNPSITSWLIFFAAHLAMNGRGVIAWSAWLICVSSCIDMGSSRLSVVWLVARVLVSCFLATVSTGVFVVVVASFLIFAVCNWRVKLADLLSVRSGLLCLLAIPLIYVFFGYFILAVEKNLDFYGGGLQGFFKMLSHGMGRMLLSAEHLFLLLPLLFLTFMLLFVFAKYLSVKFTELRKLLAISILGGLFGFTVLTLSIPLVLCELEVMKRNLKMLLGKMQSK